MASRTPAAVFDATRRVALWSRLAATGIVLLALGLIATQQPSGLQRQEPPPIRMIVETTLPPPPPPAPEATVRPSQEPQTKAPVRPQARQPAGSTAPARPTAAQPAVSPSALPPRPAAQLPSSGGAAAAGTPRTPEIARAAPSQRGPAAPGQGLSAGSRNTLRSLECQRLDPQDRPPDCPSQGARLQADADAANGPQYRPEQVAGFSRVEAQARYAAGLRAPCQQENGAQASVCVPIGPAPSRVRSPEEICRAQGLSNCVPLPKPDRP